MCVRVCGHDVDARSHLFSFPLDEGVKVRLAELWMEERRRVRVRARERVCVCDRDGNAVTSPHLHSHTHAHTRTDTHTLFSRAINRMRESSWNGK